jgi:acyl transferase domain-containing protein
LNSPSNLQPTSPGLTVEPIAIIGIACRFPGEASNPQELWANLASGRSAWSKQPHGRYNLEAYQDRENPVGITVCRTAMAACLAALRFTLYEARN